MIDLAGMPVRSLDRDSSYPLVIAGGHACYNPEPMTDFIDAFVIGEGEEIIVEIARCVQTHARVTAARLNCGRWPGFKASYVPRFYDVEYNLDGTVASTMPNVPEAPARVLKRIVPVLPKPFTKFLVPNIDTVHNRAPIEIMRGCTRGCRFCHAGMVTRPVRERSVQEVVGAVAEIMENTGFEEISLLSLSSSDYRDVHELVSSVHEHYAESGLSMSLPSLRIEIGQRRTARQTGRHAPQRLYLCAGSRYRADAQHDQQIRADRSGAEYRARRLRTRLAHDQVLLHDRPSRRDD